MKVAAVDIGTNTLRMLIAEFDKKWERLRPLRRERIVTRLGDSFIVTGLLKKEAMERTLVALERFKSIAEEEYCERVIPIATSCVREAKNGREFVRLVKKRIGWDIIVIDGTKEAYLTYLGIKKGLDVRDDTVMFDVGGGSTEYIFSNNAIKTISIPIGVVKLRDLFMKNDPPLESELEEIRGFVRKSLAELKGLTNSVETVIGTAGTATTLAAIKLKMKEYNPDLIHGTLVSFDEIVEIFNILKVIPSKERLKVEGMEQGREDLIFPYIRINQT